ncbi:MAG: hypothetical protein HC860_13665 [Alkalinema sp. RU_4_3]|nr:hypothetical protein [Alkalinema sp. RU_4_3]NJR71580.1 hypothetical protein [Synechococcales cyanobacterium CRU_2_2]
MTTQKTTSKKKSGLGNNPLAPATKGIFEKTAENPEGGNPIPENGKQQSPEATIAPAGKQKTGSRKKKPEPGFLAEDQKLDKVTVRIPIELNDWLDDLLKQGKRKHGQKVPKEIWLQAALELFKVMPVDWSEVQSIEQMREKLHILENGIHNPEKL